MWSEYTLDNQNNPQIVADDIVVSLQYTLTVDGKVVDSADRDEPLIFIQGSGDIIPGLESQLYGMATGDNKKVSVESKDGYGELDPESSVEIPRSQFPPEIPVKKGIQLQVQNNDDEVMDAFIDSFTRDTIRLDFNHPLAGKQLLFDVTVVGLRPATEEELAHGHVHGEDKEDEDEDEEFSEDNFSEENA
jgi:FKBP-type peptidyl-prolyl cis-trans isomerase SlyD